MGESRLLPGLWFNTLTIRIEETSTRMKKACDCCAKLPEDRRLVIQKGSGRRHTITVFCTTCGIPYLEEKVEEAKRAVLHLKAGNVRIRSRA
jgi:hypothetical protein